MIQVVQAKCPHCQNVLRIPAEWLAQPMRCRFCKQVIQARGPVSAAAGPIAPAQEAHAAFAMPVAVVTAPVAGMPMAKGAAAEHMFGFDAAPTPGAPAVAAPPFSRRRGKGWIIAGMLLVGLTTAAIMVVVFLGQPLRDLFQGKTNENIVEVNPKKKQIEAATDKANADKTNSDKSNNDKGSTDKKTSDKASNDKAVIDKSNKDKDKKITDKSTKGPDTPPDKGPEVKPMPPKDGGDPPPKKKNIKPVTKEPELFPRRALLINVNNYWLLNPISYGDAQKAGFPGSSTSVLANRLSNAPMYFPATQVAELSDSASSPIIPSKYVIEDAILDFCNTSRDQDRVIVLFAGHAVEIDKDAYLVPYDGNKDDAKTLIPLSWVFDKLAKCKARQKVLILDVFRNPPARGFELPGVGGVTGTSPMTEDFDAKLQSPPPGVQVWTACVKDQNSIEFESGSVFLQSLSLTMKDRPTGGDGFAKPQEAIPIEEFVPKVNQRMKELLKGKFEQVSRLSGKEPDDGAPYDAKVPFLAAKITLQPPVLVENSEKASGALINNILAEMKQIPPMKASLKRYMDGLDAASLPPFSKKVMDFYKADYKSWGELETKLKEKEYMEKHPLRAAVLEAKKALDKAQGLNMRETLTGPINEKTKASFLNEQKEPALMIFEMEQALAALDEAEKLRDKEDSKRWQANFDYTRARLLARLVYIDEYNYTLGSIRGDRLPALENGESGWRLGFKQKVSTNENKVKNRVKDISKLWKKIAEDHPNTPWALLAQRESLYAFGLEWRAARD